MILSEWDKIDAATLAQLCVDQCPESDSLDFKRTIGRPEELQKDVSAMANSNGGDLVIGIDEENGHAGSLAPLTGESPDAAILRIAQTLDGLEPRVRGLRYKHVEVQGGYVVIIRVPRSFDGPHSFRVNAGRRFVLRNGPGTSDMSFEQLRSAFDRTATLAQRAADHASRRLRAIAANEAPVKLVDGPLCVVQLVPIGAIADSTSVDVVALHRNGYADFMGPGWSGATPRLTLDGLLVYPHNRAKPTYGYSLVYRSGILESVRQYGEYRNPRPGIDAEAIPIMGSQDVAIYFQRTISLFAKMMRQWGISGPAVLSIAMLRVQEYQLGAQSVFFALEPAVADRPDLVLPDQWIERVEDVPAEAVARQALDTIWQSFGLERCDALDAAIRLR